MSGDPECIMKKRDIWIKTHSQGKHHVTMEVDIEVMHLQAKDQIPRITGNHPLGAGRKAWDRFLLEPLKEPSLLTDALISDY